MIFFFFFFDQFVFRFYRLAVQTGRSTCATTVRRQFVCERGPPLSPDQLVRRQSEYKKWGAVSASEGMYTWVEQTESVEFVEHTYLGPYPTPSGVLGLARAVVPV